MRAELTTSYLRRMTLDRSVVRRSLLALLLLTTSLWAVQPTASATLSGDSARSVAREPQLQPDQLGNGVVDGLQYANPTEGLALVSPPVGNSGGGAQIEYPFIIPPGRGITPGLTLSYDSGGGNGWAGLGWDLSVGEISVDTAFGAPHFDPAYESESYLLNGDLLVPNATDDVWEPRVAERQDYTRQVETEFQQIIRHGDSPKNYFWEVRDKWGNIFWYGGKPDPGGPFGGRKFEDQPDGRAAEIDPQAIVYDNNDNAVKWYLSAQRDVGVNQIRYYYTTLTYARTTDGWLPQTCSKTDAVMCARHTYLDHIDYTEAAEVAPDPAWQNDAPYRVEFQLQSETNPSAAVRSDPIVDGSGGFVDLVYDRLSRVLVWYGDPKTDEPRSPRDYNQVAVRYDLEYEPGPFGKSLLSRVGQISTTDAESAWHEFEYADLLTRTPDGYDAFGDPVDWTTGSDIQDQSLLNIGSAAVGALGASVNNTAEGHAYIGFNAAIPQKVGSFGGSIQIGAGGTEALAEWIDLNGDSLPDKVWKDGTSFKFRLNESGPDGGDTFSDWDNIGGSLPRLSRDTNVSFQLSVEAHLGVTLAVGIGGDVEIGDSYFTDVNADGLVDFVSSGSVYFNRLVNDIPTFSTGSTGTLVPLPADGGSPSLTVDEVADLQETLEAQSPPVDTVKRWRAPFAGTVKLDAQVQMTGVNSLDGVRVAIQLDDAEVTAANLLANGSTAFDTTIDDVHVAAGSEIFFRVGSVDDGANDEVAWDPTITYTAITGVSNLATVPLDANGLSQLVYDSSEDFTLAGRPNSQAVVPHDGMIRFEATVQKTAVTSDALTVVLEHDGVAVPVPSPTIAASFVGDVSFSVDFAVDGPVYPTEANPNVVPEQDTIEAYLAVDSPIDITAVSWDASAHYLNATDANGDPIDVTDDNGDPTVVVDLLPEIEQYPYQSPSTPAATFQATAGTYDLAVGLFRPFGAPATSGVATIKTATGTLVAKAPFTLGPSFGPQGADVDLNAALSGSTNYFVELMLRDDADASQISLLGVNLHPNNAPNADNDVAVAGTLRLRGLQGVFPLPYRGWGVAGYTAAGTLATTDIERSAFVLQQGDFDEANAPSSNSAAFDDIDPSSTESNAEPSYAFVPDASVEAVPGTSVLSGPQWRGPRANHAASSTRMRTSRLGADSVALSAGPGVASGDGTAVTRVGVAAPSASLAIGAGPFGGSLGIGPSFGLVDYEDMNGDGYPDVMTPGTIHYTNQRGGYLTSSTSVSDLAVINQDLTISASGGLSVQLVDIKGNSKGQTNANHGGAAAKGGAANDSSGGMGIGGNVSASWTSPNASNGGEDPSSTYAEDLGDVPDESTGGTADIQVALADVNGDGLPDRVFTTPQGTFAQYNIGYRFTTQSVQLAGGGFESRESYSGTASLGFSTPWAEFSGGFALNWNYDQSRTSWRDVNGDGILDQVKKVEGDAPLVRFGTGSGVLDPVEYGDVASSDTTLVPAGQQIAFDQANGAGGGFDFTVYIGPLCLVACYLVINPGFSYQYSISTTRIDLQDVNGDGFADSVSTANDDTLTVRLNEQEETNLLESVSNPIGGSFSLEYGRDGNTVDHPDSTWTLESVTVDDGRPGDGADIQKVEYDYSGLKYDRVHRQSLGYSTVTGREIDVRPNPDLVLRTSTTEYHNESVFTTGLEKSVTIETPGGQTLHKAMTTWGFRDVRDVSAGFDVLAEVTPVDVSLLGDTDSVASRGRSIAPMVTRTDEEWYEAGTKIKSTYGTFAYDGLGNMLEQFDAGEPDDADDDILVATDFADCVSAASSDLGCMPDVDPPNVNTSPLFSDDLCPTWVSLPVDVTVTNAKTGPAREVYRHRDGRGDVCDNASMTHHEETINADGDIGATELTYDEWGSYDRIVYPADADDLRYAVHYEWDDDGHGKIAQVTEYDLYDIPDNSCDLENYIEKAEDNIVGNEVVLPDDVCDAVDVFMLDDPSSLEDLSRFAPASAYPPFDLGDTLKGTMSSATFDPLNGRVASRTDANDNTIDYEYDSLARIKTISSPRPEDTDPLVSFTYQPLATGYAHAKASHLDIFHSGDTIDTFTFVDGIGRTTQTKRDARLFQGAGQAPDVGRSVSGAVEYDALGRVEKEYLPTEDTGAATGYETVVGPLAVQTVYDLNDRVTKITKPGTPGNRVTEFVYGAAARDPGGPSYFTTKITEPNLRATTNFFDIRGVTKAIDDKPAALATALRTRFEHDGMGQLLLTTDRAGNQTTYEYDLAGRRITTTTPDGGEVAWDYDAQGKLTSETTPNLRLTNTSITYEYDLNKLTSIVYPGETPDVTYTYGVTGDPHNGAGRVIQEEDGSRIVTMEYNEAGAMTKQLAETKYHNWFDAIDKSPFQTTMEWTYDGLGRIHTVTYPDGEILTYGYDEGGLAQTVAGVEEGLIRQQIGIDPITGEPIFVDVPHTWTYEYLRDRQYDQMLRVRWTEVGNSVTTELTFDPNTQWLSRQQSFSPDRVGPGPEYAEIQDLNYTYDSVGNPTEYRNNLPPATPSLMGGSSVHRYRYDPLERIVGGTGIYDLSDNRHERYELTLTYDANGNVRTKDQYDAVVRKPYDPVTPPPPVDRSRRSTDLVNTKNTFAFTRTYRAAQPHQAIAAAGESYQYDANGNMLGLKDSRGRWIRQIQWDANDRMALVTDGPSSTEYRYDDSGNRMIERGPAGETAFVNPFITTRNRNELYKHIWVDKERIATQRDDGPFEETKRYFLHKDLQGSTNLVTDAVGQVFQHHEYFPNGDVWIDEKSTQFRTPYQFGGAYIDEVRDIANMGARWYDQNREIFYAPDPALSLDPTALMRKPAMAAAYAYSGSNPIGNIDPSGLEFFTVQRRAAVLAEHADNRAYVASHPVAARTIVEAHETRLPRGLVKFGVNIKQADRVQKFSEKLEANPIVEVDLNEGTVKIGAPYGKRIRIPRNQAAATNAANTGNAGGANTGGAQTTAPVAANAVPQDAANASGAPANGAPSNPAPNANAVQPTAVNQAVSPPPPVNNAPPPKADARSPVQRSPQVRQRSGSAPAVLLGGSRADE
jgi:RHS repeat-associated protein